jgi:alkylhydroperoxidase/carboxymuconolactone decarboxylase family protein YurZ
MSTHDLPGAETGPSGAPGDTRSAPMFRPVTFEATAQLLDELDPNFAAVWTGYVSRMDRRTVLDLRTSLLIRIGQFTCLRNEQGLADATSAAVTAGVAVREILDVMLQCTVVAGDVVLHPALDVFRRIVVAAGRMDELTGSRLPVQGTDGERLLETEMASWDSDDAADPRCAKFIEKYGWLGISTGLRLRPHHMLEIVEYLDSLDPEFTDIWLEFCYHGLYSRSVLDDRTRLICQAADCIAVGHLNQARAHMRGAIRHGGTARELLEMIFQGMVHLGMPTMFAALKVLLGVLAEDGQLDQIGTPLVSEQLQKTVG